MHFGMLRKLRLAPKPIFLRIMPFISLACQLFNEPASSFAGTAASLPPVSPRFPRFHVTSCENV